MGCLVYMLLCMRSFNSRRVTLETLQLAEWRWLQVCAFILMYRAYSYLASCIDFQMNVCSWLWYSTRSSKESLLHCRRSYLHTCSIHV